MYTATSIPGNSPVLCHWVVEASDSTILWTSAAATATPSIDWAFPAGAYRLVAEPDDAAAYCNARYATTISVTVPPPAVDSILGELLFCPGQLCTYEVQSPLANTRFRWEILDGGAIAVQEGRKINVSFGATPPFGLSVVQIDPLGCASEAFELLLSPIPGLTLSGPSDECREGISTFSTERHPGLDYRWAISPPGAGTIIGADNEASVDILWHYDGPATVEVQGCGQSASLNLQIHPLPEPAIQYPPALCPDESATVQTSLPFTEYEWLNDAGGLISDTPEPALPPGAYQLIAIDANGCRGDTTFRIGPYPRPEISISTPDYNVFWSALPLITVTICLAITRLPWRQRVFMAVKAILAG